MKIVNDGILELVYSVEDEVHNVLWLVRVQSYEDHLKFPADGWGWSITVTENKSDASGQFRIEHTSLRERGLQSDDLELCISYISGILESDSCRNILAANLHDLRNASEALHSFDGSPSRS